LCEFTGHFSTTQREDSKINAAQKQLQRSTVIVFYVPILSEYPPSGFEFTTDPTWFTSQALLKQPSCNVLDLNNPQYRYRVNIASLEIYANIKIQ
jgi:hypothetical protein